MATPIDVITQSLKKAGILGVGQSAQAEDVNDAFLDLNDMVAQWQRKRWLVWDLVTYSVTSTGAQSYTVGPGGNIDIAKRPDRLESAFLRQTVQSQPSQIDYPLEILQAREDYNRIALKGLTSFAEYIFYDSAYPTARIYPWPIPQASIYAIFITVKNTINNLVTLTDTIQFPDEYIPALKWNLAVRLAVSYKISVAPELVVLAEDSLNLIRNANAQIPRLTMPPEILRRGVYNPYSDQIL